MKLGKLFFLLILFGLIGGFFYVALTDIEVVQQDTVKTIPNDRFFADE